MPQRQTNITPMLRKYCLYFQYNAYIGQISLYWNYRDIPILHLYWKYLQWKVNNAKLLDLHISNELAMLQNVVFTLVIIAIKDQYYRNTDFTLEIFGIKGQYCRITGLR